MAKLAYQEYIIDANSRRLSESGRWSLDIKIEHHYGAGVEIKGYSSANTFATEPEAIEQCFIFGREIINGNVPGCTAP